MSMEILDTGDGYTTSTLEEMLQNDIDTLELSGAEGEDKTLATKYHQTYCIFSQTDGEADYCTCLPIEIDVRDVRRMGVEQSARMIDAYLTLEKE